MANTVVNTNSCRPKKYFQLGSYRKHFVINYVLDLIACSSVWEEVF